MPEYVPAKRLLDEAARHGRVDVLDIDRGYLASPEVHRLHHAGVKVHSRAWRAVKNKGLYVKEDFQIDLFAQMVHCPAGKSAPISAEIAAFSKEDCGRCKFKSHCTTAARRPSASIRRRTFSFSSELPRTPVQAARSFAGAPQSSTAWLASAPSKVLALAIAASA